MDRVGAQRTGVSYIIKFELGARKSIEEEPFMRSLCMYIQKFETGLNLQCLKNGICSSQVHGMYLNEHLSSLEMNQWMRFFFYFVRWGETESTRYVGH
jgi:hypothetical protein